MVIYQGARGQGKLPLKRTQPERRRGPKPSSASQASQRSAHLHGDLLSLAQKHHSLTIDLGLTQPGEAVGGKGALDTAPPSGNPVGTRSRPHRPALPGLLCDLSPGTEPP